MTGMVMEQGAPVLQVQDLTTEFGVGATARRAVDGVSFCLRRGEVLGLVGESGSGKTVTALSLLRLIDRQSGRVSDGKILLEGRDLRTLPDTEMRRIRGHDMAMVFQEPLSALNPCHTVGDHLREVFVVHGDGSGAATRARIRELLSMVRIPDPVGVQRRYPHELSGGMRQRVMIAMALAYTPKVLIADEPTTALDVTIQAQVLNLIDRLRRELGVAVLLITHDMGVVAQYTHRVAVMYGGRIVEEGAVGDVFRHPMHPYTEGLLASVPRLGERLRRGGTQRLPEIPGSVPDIGVVQQGCRFEPRCALAEPRCAVSAPSLQTGPNGHAVACWVRAPSPTKMITEAPR